MMRVHDRSGISSPYLFTLSTDHVISVLHMVPTPKFGRFRFVYPAYHVHCEHDYLSLETTVTLFCLLCLSCSSCSSWAWLSVACDYCHAVCLPCSSCLSWAWLSYVTLVILFCTWLCIELLSNCLPLSNGHVPFFVAYVKTFYPGAPPPLCMDYVTMVWFSLSQAFVQGFNKQFHGVVSLVHTDIYVSFVGITSLSTQWFYHFTFNIWLVGKSCSSSV